MAFSLYVQLHNRMWGFISREVLLSHTHPWRMSSHKFLHQTLTANSFNASLTMCNNMGSTFSFNKETKGFNRTAWQVRHFSRTWSRSVLAPGLTPHWNPLTLPCTTGAVTLLSGATIPQHLMGDGFELSVLLSCSLPFFPFALSSLIFGLHSLLSHPSQ